MDGIEGIYNQVGGEGKGFGDLVIWWFGDLVIQRRTMVEGVAMRSTLNS